MRLILTDADERAEMAMPLQPCSAINLGCKAFNMGYRAKDNKHQPHQNFL